MSLINLAIRYLLWHYTKAFVDFFRVWSNFFWFCLHFFSIPTLFRTLFSPWRRISEGAGGGIGEFFSSLVVNIIMRIIGFIMRLILIIAGLLSLLLVFILGVMLLILWIFAPLAILAAFVAGVILLFK